MFDQLRRHLQRGKDEEQVSPGMTGMRSFAGAWEQEEIEDHVDRGIAQVRLERIVGSVGRYRDFDQRFRPRRNAPDERYLAILDIMRAGGFLPPVSLYQIRDEYFILDGHHRVMAARELGRDTIPAKIVELLPGRTSLVNILYREKVSFREKTALIEDIELSEPGQYRYFEHQIEIHRTYLEKEKDQNISYPQAAADWYRTIYQPLAALIRQSGLVDSFPGRTVADLCRYISVEQWQQGGPSSYGRSIDELIPPDMEAFRRKMAALKQNEYPDMKRSITFFVLLNVDGRMESRIIDRLKGLDEVCEVHSVHGAIDIIIKVLLERDLLSSDAELISQFTHTCIRTMKGVQATQTLIPGLSWIREVSR